MGTIQVLPERIANKIAAGEVVERPASVVKELIENALDAKATSIELEIQHGGKSLIRLSDNGIGMDRADAKTAFQRHATSKIISLEDLNRIGSYGFRGEALPSIAAVSRTRLITRPKGASAGTEVVITGGILDGVKDCPCSPGTIIEVRDLFFNTPARRKFMKSDTTELGHVQELVSHMALCALGVRFVFRVGEKTIFDLPATDDFRIRAAALFGEEIAAGLLEIRAQEDGVELHGLIGKPALNRANRSGVSLFINRRWVKALSLSYALQAGYHGLLMHGRFPVALLFLNLDLERVDVNVHPTKQEVRISNEAQVTGLIERSVKEGLGRAGNLAPARNYTLHSGGATERPWGVLFEKPGLPSLQSVETDAPIQAAAADSEILFKGTLCVTKILGQIHNTFLVAETEEGWMIVDQHAAHERIMFEALMKSLQDGQVEKQNLLLDEVLELHPKHHDLFTGSLPMLARLGFEIEEFGEKTFVIRALPAVFGKADPIQLLTSFLEEQEDGKSRTVLEDQKETVAALCACKKQSVKARDPLDLHSIRKLLERLARCENPFSCPHGRPVFFTQSFSDLERQFKRT